jgi:hypothetical protein
VPSRLHEVLVEFFRSRPQLARELLYECAGISTIGSSFALASIDLSQVMPGEYRADAVIVIHDDGPTPIAAVIVEVQLQIDGDKRRTWPLYVAALHARLHCPTSLLVLSPDESVAR